MKKQCEVGPEKIKTTPVAKNIMISDDFIPVYFHKWLKNDTTKATDITRMRPLSSKQLIQSRENYFDMQMIARQ